MVFNASFKTPGGNSLNGVLDKGQNRLCKLQHLLVPFRQGQAAVTADISMAYNGTKLRSEHLKYQKYFWKDDLLPENPTKAIFGRFLRKNSLYSCQLLTGRSKLLMGMTIPKAELKAAVAGATRPLPPW